MRIPIIGIVGEDEPKKLLIPQPNLENLVKTLLPNYSQKESWWFDTYYRVFRVDNFKYVLDGWRRVLNLVQYSPEYFDCDDFADLFKSYMSLSYYNCVGLVVGELYNKNMEFLGYHAWNLIVFVNQVNYIKVFEFEPQIGEILINHRSSDGFVYKGMWVIW